jgi:hypothetical protein
MKIFCQLFPKSKRAFLNFKKNKILIQKYTKIKCNINILNCFIYK